MLVAHMVAGLLALLAGAVALSVRKGGAAHRRYGKIFVATMLAMASLGALMGARKVISGITPDIQMINVVAGTITFYLVLTAFLTVRPESRARRWIDRGATLVGLAIGLVAVQYSLGALMAPKVRWFPGIPALIFATVALLAVMGDMRVFAKGGIQGRARIARHLWRMCFAMFVATGSFFLGQAKVFPEELRIVPLLAAPVLAVLALMLYWMVRVRWRGEFAVPSTR